MDLEDVVNDLIDYKKSNAENSQIINRGPTSINGKDFYSFLLRISNDEVVVRDLNLVTGVEDTPYIFNLQSRDDPSNQELSDQLYSEGLSILQQIIMSAELTGLNLDSLEEGTDEGGGDDFNPFEQNQMVKEADLVVKILRGEEVKVTMMVVMHFHNNNPHQVNLYVDRDRVLFPKTRD